MARRRAAAGGGCRRQRAARRLYGLTLTTPSDASLFGAVDAPPAGADARGGGGGAAGVWSVVVAPRDGAPAALTVGARAAVRSATLLDGASSGTLRGFLGAGQTHRIHLAAPAAAADDDGGLLDISLKVLAPAGLSAAAAAAVVGADPIALTIVDAAAAAAPPLRPTSDGAPCAAGDAAATNATTPAPTEAACYLLSFTGASPCGADASRTLLLAAGPELPAEATLEFVLTVRRRPAALDAAPSGDCDCCGDPSCGCCVAQPLVLSSAAPPLTLALRAPPDASAARAELSLVVAPPADGGAARALAAARARPPGRRARRRRRRRTVGYWSCTTRPWRAAARGTLSRSSCELGGGATQLDAPSLAAGASVRVGARLALLNASVRWGNGWSSRSPRPSAPTSRSR